MSTEKNLKINVIFEGQSKKITMKERDLEKERQNFKQLEDYLSTYNDQIKRSEIVQGNVNEKIHIDVFTIARSSILDLKKYTEEEQRDIKKIRKYASNFLFICLGVQIGFLILVSFIDIFCRDVPKHIYQIFAITVIGNLATLIAIILKYGFTNYIKDYYLSLSKIIEVLGSVNNVYFKTKNISKVVSDEKNE